MINLEGNKISAGNIRQMEEIIKEKGFAMIGERNGNERCDLYSKNVVLGEQIRHPYIRLSVCYSKKSDVDMINDFRMLIINAWEGNSPLLKEEIDRVGDVLFTELKKTVSDNTIKIERNTTAPPF